jgi:hypothetical protein
MIKKLIAPLTFCCVAGAQADCIPDTTEIGDTGPDGSNVCQMLEQRFPQLRFEILGRDIRTADTVSVVVSIDGRRQPLNYRLHGADWILTNPRIVDIR